ncbi:efflux RND transporter periplasmic adaptor subunit [Myxococcota bacterium]|nr:efflux RND transporter periplasmic adaptor subunit [Myxococcota bacterium]
MRWLPLLALAMVVGCQASPPPAANAPRTRVRTAPVAIETRVLERRLTGYTFPFEAHGPGFLVAGRVTSLAVDAGDRVRKGQLLATLAPEDYALQKRLAEIQVEALAPNVERVDRLVQEQALPQATRDEVQGRWRAALTQREQADRLVGHTRLVSPIDGVVLERRTAVGQVIGAGMPAVVLLDLSRVKVKLAVTQSELALFEVGTEVAVDFPGVAQNRPGRVHSVSLLPDTKTRTWEVEVAVDNADGLLRPGLLARVSRQQREVSGIFIPLDTVRHDLDRQPLVLVMDPSTRKVLARPVSLGDLFGTKVQVLSGLAEGDLLIVEGQGFVNPGDEVLAP